MSNFEEFYKHIEDWCEVRLGVADKSGVRSLIEGLEFMSRDFMVATQISVDFLYDVGFESRSLYGLRAFYQKTNRQNIELLLEKFKSKK